MTEKYAAPEVVLNNPVPFKSDIFSLGVILFNLMTKILPKTVQDKENLK